MDTKEEPEAALFEPYIRINGRETNTDVPELFPDASTKMLAFGKIVGIAFVFFIASIFFCAFPLVTCLYISPIFVLLAWGIYRGKAEPRRKLGLLRDDSPFGAGCYTLDQRKRRLGI